jgi:hypothetical protein
MLAEMFTVLNLHFGRWVCCSSWLHGWLAVIVLSLLWRYQASGFPEDKIWTDVLPLLQLTGFCKTLVESSRCKFADVRSLREEAGAAPSCV